MLMKRILIAVYLFVVLGAGNTATASEGDQGKLSLFSGDLGNTIWTVLIFFTVVVVLGKFAWGPMLKALQNRENFIRDSLTSAQRDQKEAKERLNEYEQKLENAKEDVTAMIETGRSDGEQLKRQIEGEARTNAEQMIERARREMTTARDEALKELYDRSSQLAIGMAGNVLKRQLTPEDHQKLVEETLAEMQKMPDIRG